MHEFKVIKAQETHDYFIGLILNVFFLIFQTSVTLKKSFIKIMNSKQNL